MSINQRQKMLDLNQNTLDQNNQIKQITRTAQQAYATQNAVLNQLDNQGNKIKRNIDAHKEIKKGIKNVEKTTVKMTRRAICMKCTLYIAAIVLFALNILLILYKLGLIKGITL